MTDTNAGGIDANLVDLAQRRIRASTVSWQDGRITTIAPRADGIDPALPFLLPGFIDAHIHIESSLLPPAEFARIAVRHGTVATVSDPHEIANVLGIAGVRWMLDNAAASPFHFLFGAPSCVPATPMETAGATLDADAVAALLALPGIGHLSEVMNFPGVLAGDAGLLAKIAAARARGQPVDGHAPGLAGDDARRYAAAGISTDHECTTLAEAEGKIAAGMKILLREGSAARNFDALHPLICGHPGQVMFCSDDRHPDDLVAGHIDRLVARAVSAGHDVFDVLDAACAVPQRHYGLALGLLAAGDPFNAVLVQDLRVFSVLKTWLDGRLVAADGISRLPRVACTPANRFDAAPVQPAALRIPAPPGEARLIGAQDGELFTRALRCRPRVQDGFIAADIGVDCLPIAVVNRYAAAAPALALVNGFGLRHGAIASSVAHDSHNIVAVGCDETSLAAAINAVIAARGGLALADGPDDVDCLPLPVAGLMSDLDGDVVARRYAALNTRARDDLGSPLRAPFMTLSFMSLTVIPALKLGDRGLFDGNAFRHTTLAC